MIVQTQFPFSDDDRLNKVNVKLVSGVAIVLLVGAAMYFGYQIMSNLEDRAPQD